MQVDFNNPSQRTPCVLVLDASGSMQTREPDGRSRIEHLSDGLRAFHSALFADPVALARVQIAAVNAGGPIGMPRVFMDWTDASEFEPFQVIAEGDTPLGAALLVALNALEEHKLELKRNGISYTRPWVMVLTDGEPTDAQSEWIRARESVRAAEAAGKIEIFPIAIGSADLSKLAEISNRPALKLSAVKFREFFVWLSSSLGQIARSVPGERVTLPSTDPWASVRL
jgi:uncharacterized protein YegL